MKPTVFNFVPWGQPKISVEDISLTRDTDKTQTHVGNPHPIACSGYHNLTHIASQFSNTKLLILLLDTGSCLNLDWHIFTTVEPYNISLNPEMEIESRCFIIIGPKRSKLRHEARIKINKN